MNLIVECYPERKQGGQTFGSGPCGVKITHKPTGLVAICDYKHSQHKNRKVALDMIEYGLAELGLKL